VLQARLEDSMVLVEEITEFTRGLMGDLRPPDMDLLGLVASVGWYGERFSARTGVDVVVEGKEIQPRPAPEIENNLFRIVQEVLTNIGKHARAGCARILSRGRRRGDSAGHLRRRCRVRSDGGAKSGRAERLGAHDHGRARRGDRGALPGRIEGRGGDAGDRRGSVMSISVFLADDHTIVRDGLRSLLEAHGDMKIVGEAANGRDAIRAVRKLKPDVVIMDILMADLNGIEATEQICRECPATRVVILSMQSSSESILRALRAGARGYLFKESAGRELIQAIHAVRAGHRYLSAKVSDQVVGAFLKQEEAYRDPLSVLSRREREVLQLVVEGRTSAEIAGTLFLSVKTVETYRSRLMKKLGIGDIPGLIKFAIQHGLTSLE